MVLVTKKGQKEVRRTLYGDAVLVLGRRPACKITRKDVVLMIMDIVERGANVQAGNVLRELSAAYEFAIGQDRFDSVNYARSDDEYPTVPATYKTDNDYLRALRALSRPGTPFVALINDYDANLAHMRVRMNSGRDFSLTMIANRWHDNVGFLLTEDKRLNHAKDSINFIPGLIGSYPNFFIDIRENDVPDFLQLLSQYSGSAEDEQRLLKYGVRRTDARFWDTFDWFQHHLLASDPVRGGLLYLNRYSPIAK